MNSDNSVPAESRERVCALFASTAVFADLNRADLEAVAEQVEATRLRAAEILFRQGDPGDYLYVIAEGRLQVSTQAGDGAERLLATLTAGDCIGEVSILTQGPRTATVSALGDALLYGLPRKVLDGVFASHPDVRRRLVEFASRRLPSLHLGLTDLFRGLDPSLLRTFDRDSNWIRLPGGETLIRQGDAAEELYVVMQGRLEVVVERDGGTEEVVEQIGQGACVGEMALLVDEPRSATVRALRDSELVRLSRSDFYRLLEEHPRAAVELSRTLVRRLRQTTAAHRNFSAPSTIALLPSPGPLPPEFANRLDRALERIGGDSLHLTSRRLDETLGSGSAETGFDEPGHARIAEWLMQQESVYRFVLYECDGTDSRWTERCLRQADLILIVGQADGDPRPGAAEARILLDNDGRRMGRRRLVLVHPDGAPRPEATFRWLEARNVESHHHVRRGRDEDYERLVREIMGKSLGVVLSGGGARGFAHIGALRALQENGFVIDAIGGTSMGSLLAAQFAMGYDLAAMVEMNRRCFVDLKLLIGSTLPMVSLVTAKRFVRMLQSMYGDARIEDLWIPYFCVSSNLSRAQLVVHDRGPLWFCVRASCSVPGIEPPVVYGGDLLIDGGVLNNLPIDVMRNRNQGRVIAVDVSPPIDLTVEALDSASLSGWPLLWSTLNPFSHRRTSMPGIMRILSRTAMLPSVRNAETTRSGADLYMHPPTDGVDMFAWKGIEQIVDIGYRFASRAIADWKKNGEPSGHVVLSRGAEGTRDYQEAISEGTRRGPSLRAG